MKGMEIELEDFQDGKPVTFRGENSVVEKVVELKAARKYKQLLQLTYQLPNNVDTYLLRATTLLHLKEWNKLIECCTNGLLLKDDESQFYNLKGKAMGKLGNQQQKISLIKIALDLNDKVAAYHRNLGAAYYSVKKFQQAITAHSQAIKIQPNNSINYHNIGAAYFRTNELQLAKKSFKLAIQKDEKLALSYSWLGDCERKMGGYEEAIKLYGKAYEISGNMVYQKQKEKLENQVSQLRGEKKKKFFFGLF